MPVPFNAPDPLRRRLLAWGGLAALAPHTGCAPVARRAAATPPDPRGLPAFLSASRRVTGHERLNRELAEHLYAALRSAYPALEAHLAELGAKQGGGQPVAAADARVATPAHAQVQEASEVKDAESMPAPDTVEGLERRLLRAWYLGLVGDGWDTRAYAYEAALMYPPVADKVVMQSYCHGAPGYWAEPA